MTAPDKKYRCGVCNAEFNSQEELDRHTRSAHKGASPEPSTPGRKENPSQPR